MKKANLNKLLAIYDAIDGMASETLDPFDGFYKGGTDALLADFEAVLADNGVKFVEREKGNYYIVSYMNFIGREWEKLGVNPRKQWGICTDKEHPNASWVLTGFDTTADALKAIMNPNIFDDYNGQPVEEIDAVDAA